MQTNHLAINLLKELGHIAPTEEQVNLLVKVLSVATNEAPLQISFNNRLTPPEISCLYLIAKGYSNLEAAGLLHIAVATVKTHRSTILRKLGCSNFSNAVYEGMRLGYLQREENLYQSAIFG